MFFMGKSTMNGPFFIVMLVDQRGITFYPQRLEIRLGHDMYPDAAEVRFVNVPGGAERGTGNLWDSGEVRDHGTLPLMFCWIRS